MAAKKNTKKSASAPKVNAEKYFRNYLRLGPLGLALWRSVEAKHMSKVTLKHPMLDIGCGFGEYAVAYDGDTIDMGIDINAKDLYIAAKTKKYKNLTLADAADLPFSDNSYASVFSISTLEHIHSYKKCLQEMYRVLKPGGVMFLTLETDEVDNATFYRPFLNKYHMGKLSTLIDTNYNKIFHRENLLPKSYWIDLVEQTGFVIDKKQDIISAKVNKLFDILLITAWPSQLSRPFIGKRVVFRPKIAEDFLVKKFLKYVNEEEKSGTNLLLVAHKPRAKK